MLGNGCLSRRWFLSLSPISSSPLLLAAPCSVASTPSSSHRVYSKTRACMQVASKKAPLHKQPTQACAIKGHGVSHLRSPCPPPRAARRADVGPSPARFRRALSSGVLTVRTTWVENPQGEEKEWSAGGGGETGEGIEECSLSPDTRDRRLLQEQQERISDEILRAGGARAHEVIRSAKSDSLALGADGACSE